MPTRGRVSLTAFLTPQQAVFAPSITDGGYVKEYEDAIARTSLGLLSGYESALRGSGAHPSAPSRAASRSLSDQSPLDCEQLGSIITAHSRRRPCIGGCVLRTDEFLVG